ncbi:MAG TPA: hypothetical protein DCY13_03995, partial [Verrucomicrobiales bacterium]|nr:hypothetical protein [Verrucomicrobiales bacterium]
MNWLRPKFILPAVGVSAMPLLAADNAPFNYEIISALPDSKWEVNYKDGVATYSNGVIVISEDTILSADRVTFYQDADSRASGEVLAMGQVRIQRGEQIWVGETIRYNFITGDLMADSFRTGQPPFFVAGVTLDGNEETGLYTGYGVTLTTDDYAEPAQTVRARSVGIAPGEYVELYSPTLKLGPVPILWLPYMKRSLKSHPSFFTVFPGYRSRYGAYVLGGYHWFHEDDAALVLRTDYRSRRGFGTGLDLTYDLGRFGDGDLSYYWTHDDDAGLNRVGDGINPARQRFRFYHRADIEPDFTARAMMRYQSDDFIVRDFFESEYRDNVQPGSYVELEKNWSNFGLNIFAQPQLNGFQETVERLPDVKFSAYRQQVGVTPLYYESETTSGWYRRSFADDILPEFSAFRGDTFHQIVWPNMFWGWLNFMPRAGGRFTYYSEAEGPGAVTTEQTRGVFNTGAEINFKASRVWSDAKNEFLNVEGLRHIIQPSINYVFVPEPGVRPPDLPQFDYELNSIRLLPVEFPDYNSIDTIDSRNSLRLGLFNKLQTKRANRIDNLLQWNTYTDWRLDPEPGQATFSDLYSELDFAPTDWVTLTSEVRMDVNDPRLLEGN